MDALTDLETHVKVLASIVTGGLVLLGLVKLLGKRARRVWQEAVGVKQVLLGRPAIVDKRTGREVDSPRKGIGVMVEELAEAMTDLATAVSGLRGEVEVVHGKVGIIEHEVQYNNGSSIKDAAHRTEQAVGLLTSEVAGMKERLRDGDEKFAALEETLRLNAEAQRALWPAIEAIANSSPPQP